jgi:hypothetical protein
MTRSVSVAVLMVVLAAGGVARAQGTGSGSGTGSLPNGATIVFEHRQIFENGKFFEPQAGSSDLLHYFNLAHCNCAKANLGKPNTVGTFNYLVRETGLSGVHFGVDFWAGTSCDDPTHRTGGSSPTCVQFDSSPDIDNSLYPGGVYKNFNLYQVVNGTQTTVDCLTLDNANNSIFALVDTAAGSTNYNYSASQVVGTLNGETTTVSGTDTKPPPLPTAKLKATPNENEIDISWTPPTDNNTDIAYYQALCAIDEPDTPPARSQTHSPQYVTTQATCPGTDIPMVELPTPTPLDNGEAEVTMPGGAFGALDAKYICGQASSGTANSLQIKGLENGTAYQVILVSIDLHGNFSATYFDHTITPHLVTDFWEDLHDHGSQAQGGLCLLAETYGNDSALTRALRSFRDDTLGGSQAGRWLGRAYYATLARLGAYVHGSIALRALAAVALAPLVAFALLWHWLGLPVMLGVLAAAWWYRRRRRGAARRFPVQLGRRALGAAAGLGLIVLGAGSAHAGGGYQPYWEDSDPTRQSEQEQVPPGDSSLVEWHAGVRIGPYTPDIDNQLNQHPGPFEQMFGTKQHLLTMLDVDRFLWTDFGQVGVGVSLGYWQKTARAFGALMDGTPTTTRDASAHNALRLVPVALTATYRFTWFDDNYGVPVVPYVRGGFSYYVWWISINDHFARVCNGGGIEPSCIGGMPNKALGASLGVQGSIGLAIRAERIDASAAMSMQQSGIQHAGIYGELSLAKVDGFGSDSKLSVGDRTWFAGVDFEF